MGKYSITLGLLIAILAIYLCFWPVPVEPVVWEASTNPGYTGYFEQNERLEAAEKLSMGQLSGPEAAIVMPNGDVIATSYEGWLVKYFGGQGSAKPWIDLGGRPLGIALGGDGNIWVANAYLGLQKVTLNGDVSVGVSSELTSVEGTNIGYADDLAWASNGKLYISDASMRFPAKDWGGTYPASILDVVEHSKTGRVIEFDPITKASRVIKSDLSFANGVAASGSGDYILVNETGEYRIWKIWVAGEKEGRSEVVLESLPGFPDNIARGSNNTFWLGVVSPRAIGIDWLAGKPFLRKVLMRLPQFLQPQAKHYGMVLQIDENGEVLANLQSPSGEIYTTTGVAEGNGALYITSLTAPFLARFVQ